MINVGIVGGAGYTAGELIRLLLHHPETQIQWVRSTSHGGQRITDIHTDLLGETDLRFTSEINMSVDLIFLAIGHGRSREFLQDHVLNNNVKIIDLSQDFRVDTHPERQFIYGLPELNKAAIRKTDSVANPGCFATAIQIGLLPLFSENLLSKDVQITGITGSTGAGHSPKATTHFSWRANNLSVYKPFGHQHLREIYQTIQQIHPAYKQSLNFVPVRGDFSRGIMAIMHTKITAPENEITGIYSQFYAKKPFVHLSEQNPHLKQVINTNKCVVHLAKHGSNLLIISVLDNLLKGASGQAVQNMNLMFGLPETTGLQLKPSVF